MIGVEHGTTNILRSVVIQIVNRIKQLGESGNVVIAIYGMMITGIVVPNVEQYVQEMRSQISRH